jgi:VanZ family protein
MTKASSRFLKFHLPLYAWMGIIFCLSSIPQAELPEVEMWGFEPIAHTVEYLILGFLLLRALRHSRLSGLNMMKLAIFSLAIGIIYALTDELHQYFVPGREMSAADFLYDTLGLFIGVIVYNFYEKRAGYDDSKTF